MRKIISIIASFLIQQTTAQDFNYERIWATYYGGENTYVQDNAQDSQGNIYIVGYMTGTATYLNSFVTPGSFQTTFGGGISDGFMAKFDSNGLLLWATFIGGANADRINTIAIDSQDRIFVAGKTTSEAMATPGSYKDSPIGLDDAYLAEFASSGTRIWATYYGGNYVDSFSGIESDENGNLYLFGKTSSQENITSIGSFNEIFVPNPDVSEPEADVKNFLVRFTKDGDRLWGTYYGTNFSNSTSTITGISLNETGLFVVGYVIDTTMNSYFATVGCHQSFNSNSLGIGVDMFISRFSFSGSRDWSTYFGGSLSDKSIAYGVGESVENFKNIKAVNNFVYISGTSNSDNGISTPGVFQPTKQNYSNFLVKFNNVGVRQWGTYLGNSGPSSIGGGSQYTLLNIDAEGEIFISGSTKFSDVASPGSYQPLIHTNDLGLANSTESFTARISKDGATRYFGTYYGGEQSEFGVNTLIDNDNNFYIIGTTESTDEIATPNSFQSNLNAVSENPSLPKNAFLVKFSPIPLSVSTFATNNNFVYPVPNNGSFTIKLNENYFHSELGIYDMQGKKLHSEIIINSTQNIDVPNISTGTYIIKIVSTNGLKYERKLVIR
ncbi:T9SS type A sorting domain-containing protein [Flavobacterium caeni]|uniref:Por secretion system C-terminal sorting domain-containing protein n=1 Tax=Flavobacterium caeni TaxID=490189 RepID=A0A1G5KF92_9FLAO|nr:T9SS type A sorting domain-containing protein [Flavobacterium caeni]SCY99247.1 Por secretion system C-terminal sorting domain-containing protein [Flavobacterium caeni]